MLRVASLTSLILTVAAGCVDAPGDEAEVEQGLNNCEDGPCAKNSPVIATFPFWELNTHGAPNDQHIQLEKFLIGGVSHEMIVKDGHIFGRNAMGTVSGAGLNNSQIWIRRGSQRWMIKLIEAVPVQMWAANDVGAYPFIEAYRMDWTNVMSNGQPGREFKNVCEDAKLKNKDTRDLQGVPGYVTFVFGYERIDPFYKTIYDRDTSGTWFNLGCAGHTMAKMYLTGHVEDAQTMGYKNAIEDRQAIMKMFAGDYCGKGHAFTKAGVKLDWQIDDGSMKYQTIPTGIEARWTKDGATCLSKPRVEVNPTADTLAVWPLPGDVYADIANYCTIASTNCNGPIDDFDKHHLVTANPP